MQSAEPRNRLLAMLPAAEQAVIMPQLSRVRIDAGAILCETDERPEFAFFPISGVVSSVVVLSGSPSVEASTTGTEGVVGAWLLCPDVPCPHRVIQQIPGESWRIGAGEFVRLLSELRALRDLVARYSIAMLHQSGQNAACNVRHTIEERLCRWLLTCSDRAANDELVLTQEFLSMMLGVRRQSVNLAAGALQRAGFIAYRRGGLRILDRAGLQAASCECYAAVARMFERYMAPPEGFANQHSALPG